MGKLNIANLEGISESLLIPLYFRARENEQHRPILTDPVAAEILRHTLTVYHVFSFVHSQPLVL